MNHLRFFRLGMLNSSSELSLYVTPLRAFPDWREAALFEFRLFAVNVVIETSSESESSIIVGSSSRSYRPLKHLYIFYVLVHVNIFRRIYVYLAQK